MAVVWLKSGVISRENLNSNAAFPCMQSADPGPGLAHRTSRCLMKENLRPLWGFASHPILCTSVPIRKPGHRQEIESNVRGVLGVTKTTASPISSFVTFCSFTLNWRASWEKNMLSAWLKHWQLSCPCVKLTTSFLSEVISSVDALHKHRTNIRVGVWVVRGGGCSGALVLKQKADGKRSPLNLILPFHCRGTDKRFSSRA